MKALLVGLALALTVSAQHASAQAGGIAVGAKAPTLTLDAIDGTRMDLATIVGKRPVVMEFWATWCPLCKKLEPTMQKARETYGDRVAFVGIGVKDNQTLERQRDFVKERNMSGTYLFDRAGEAVKAYQVPHTSYVVIMDATGTVLYTGVGADQTFDDAIRKAIGKN